MIGSYASVTTRPCSDTYTTNDRNIYIYNMELDRYDKVLIEDCIDNCFRWENTHEDSLDILIQLMVVFLMNTVFQASEMFH